MKVLPGCLVGENDAITFCYTIWVHAEEDSILDFTTHGLVLQIFDHSYNCNIRTAFPILLMDSDFLLA